MAPLDSPLRVALSEAAQKATNGWHEGTERGCRHCEVVGKGASNELHAQWQGGVPRNYHSTKPPKDGAKNLCKQKSASRATLSHITRQLEQNAPQWCGHRKFGEGKAARMQGGPLVQ